jgi:DNA-binding LacI/PurR family transcriptional regulator
MAAKVQTMADIARLAGVSKATVSRALNDSPLIGVETKERIRAIAREHRFQINAPARRLSLKQSRAVALVTYACEAEDSSPDLFMLEIMGGIAAALHEHDHDLLVVPIRRHDVDWPRRYVQSGRVDGFIVIAAACSPRLLAAFAELGAPFISWGVPPETRAAHSSVSGDSITGGRLATAHLLESGRSRIGFLGGPLKAHEVRDRLVGYEAALRERGREVDPALVVHLDWDVPDGAIAAAVDDLLERAPDLDGIFANSDLMALAAIDELRSRGRRVPEDVGVVGYDDISLARHSSPPLTTIRQNGPVAGRLLAENLLQQLRTGAVTAVTIPAELVVRKST